MKTRPRTLTVIDTASASASLLTGLAMSGDSLAAPTTTTTPTLSIPMSITGMGSNDMGSPMDTSAHASHHPRTSAVSHRHHLICLAAGAVGVTLLLLNGGSNVTIVGISAVLLVCPIVMGVVMRLLMRPAPQHTSDRDTRRSRTT